MIAAQHTTAAPGIFQIGSHMLRNNFAVQIHSDMANITISFRK